MGIPQIRQVFNGRLLKFYLENSILPNGHTVTLEVIRHPGAVLVVPFLTKDKIVLIRQFRPVINSYIWELPAGTLNKGEVWLKCAQRELAEETGYKAGVLKKIDQIYPAPGYSDEKILIFVAQNLNKIKTKKEIDEVIKSRHFTKKEVATLLHRGKIWDAKTICALTLAKIV